MYKQSGTSLIEVLVTVLILATGLLTMAALQGRSLANNHSSYMRSQANIFASDIIDRIRIASPAPPGTLVVPSAAQVTAIVSSLPGVTGTAACTAARVCTITITWAEIGTVASNTSEDSSTFVYVSRI